MMKFVLIPTILTVIGCSGLKTRAELRQESNGPDGPRAPAASSTKEEVRPQAASGYQGDDLDAELRSMTGRIEEVENKIGQLTISVENSKIARAQDKEDSSKQMSTLEEALKKLESQVAALSEQVNKPKPPPPPPPADPQAMFADADDLYQAKKFKEAIVAYQKYRDEFPKGNRYAEATFKLGSAFAELAMKDEARAFFDEVVAKFPKSPEAKKAKVRLRKLK